LVVEPQRLDREAGHARKSANGKQVLLLIHSCSIQSHQGVESRVKMN
jgi:hypothetical protein